MSHGAYLSEDEFTRLYEYDGPDFGGPMMDWAAKGWWDANAVLSWFWANEESLPDLSKVVRCYAHYGKDGCLFYHSQPGRGRFPVTHIYRENVKDPYPAST